MIEVMEVEEYTIRFLFDTISMWIIQNIKRILVRVINVFTIFTSIMKYLNNFALAGLQNGKLQKNDSINLIVKLI